MIRKPNKLISLALVGLMLTTSIQPIFAAKPKSSILNAAEKITKGTLKLAKKFDNVIKIIAATGVIGTIFLSRFFYKPIDNAMDDAASGVAGLVSKIPKVGPPVSKFIQDWFILDQKRNKDRILREQNIETNKLNISFEKDFPEGTIEPEVQEIRDRILSQKNSLEQIKQLEERIDNLEQDDAIANAREINESKEIIKEIKGSINTPRFILLYGPTQTGKSFSAKALAKEFGATKHIECTGAMLRNKYEGGSQDVISKLFDKAEAISTKTVPGVIIIDEFDGATFGSENGKSNGLSREIAQMLQFRLDPAKFTPGKNFRNIVVIATTNYPDDQSIPAAIKSRVQALIKIDNPNEAKRKSLIKRFLENEKLAHTQQDIDDIASDEHSAGWNVANLSRLVKDLKWRQTQNKIARAREINTQPRKKVTLGQKATHKINKLWNNAKKIPAILAFWNKKKEEVAPQPQAGVNAEPEQRLLERLPLDFVAIKAKFDLEDKAAKKTEHSELQEELELIINENIKTKTKKFLEDETLVEEEDNNSLHNLSSNSNIPGFKPKLEKLKFEKLGDKKLKPKKEHKKFISIDDSMLQTKKNKLGLSF